PAWLPSARCSRQVNAEQSAAEPATICDFDSTLDPVALMPLGNTRRKIQAQSRAAAGLIDALHVIGLALDHLHRVAGAIIIDCNHQAVRRLLDIYHHSPAG